jgi:two-component system probable response regulator PhcQ
MDSKYDYKRFAILYVDDEENSLKYFKRAFGDQFRIFTAPNAAEGFAILEQHKHDIGLLMTDQRMPGEKGVQLLERSRQTAPKIIRVLATAYSDLDAAIQAVNTGAIYKYVTKPWDIPQLESTLKRGLEFFIVQRERDQLLKEKISVLQKLMITDRVISLGILAAGLGHYVQNSLVAVRTFLDLAPSKLEEAPMHSDELRDPAFWKDFYQHVRGQVARITGLLQALGQATEHPALHFDHEIQLGETLRSALQKAQPRLAEKSLTVENAVPDDLPALTVDRNLFGRLFDLLLEDEIINVPSGGRIRFQARPVTLPDGANPGLQIQVEDNGPGLPENALRSVFDPFFLRNGNPNEFGINLMACYFIVYHHGGKIEVNSREGQGVSFALTFPLKPQPASQQTNEQEFLAKVMINDRLMDALLASA